MKGWELLKEIAEGDIKENTKFNVYRNGELYFTDYVIYNKQGLKVNNGLELIDFLTLQNMLSLDFEIIEEKEEINIQDIKEIDNFYIQGLEASGYSMTQAEYLLEDGVYDNRNAINTIIQALKQLDKQIKENK